VRIHKLIEDTNLTGLKESVIRPLRLQLISLGATSFHGPGLTVDTDRTITGVTQFVGSPFTWIRRFYVQNGQVIPHDSSKIPGMTPRHPIDIMSVNLGL
jgi:hypothetical protein